MAWAGSAIKPEQASGAAIAVLYYCAAAPAAVVCVASLCSRAVVSLLFNTVSQCTISIVVSATQVSIRYSYDSSRTQLLFVFGSTSSRSMVVVIVVAAVAGHRPQSNQNDASTE